MSEIITDKEAVSVLNQSAARGVQPANKFVTRTVVYPVQISYKEGQPQTEIRTFVRQNEYCSKSQWEQALALEKSYPDLQKNYRAMLKSQGMPTDVREPGNPLKATPIELNR